MERNSGACALKGCAGRARVINNAGPEAEQKQIYAGTWWGIFYSKQSRQGSSFREAGTGGSRALLSVRAGAGVWLTFPEHLTRQTCGKWRPNTSKSASVVVQGDQDPDREFRRREEEYPVRELSK